MLNFYLKVVAFSSGAVVMILELTATRILAPYVGGSFFVWSSLIGIILTALSLGYYWGGKLADKEANLKSLGLILLSAGLCLGLVALTETAILNFLSQSFNDIRLTAIIASLVLFAPPSTALGMVIPYLVKLELTNLKKTGEVSGRIYALSTSGSIIGTFLSGFLLIPSLGSKNILFLVSGITLALAVAILPSKNKWGPLLMVFLLFFGWAFQTKNNQFFYDKDTFYNRIILEKGQDSTTLRPILTLRTGVFRQSEMFLDQDNDLVSQYTKYYRLARHFTPHLKQALALGGGGFSYPKDFLKNYPKATLDVVELDPEVVSLAQKYFNLPQDERLSILQTDGIVFLRSNTKKYDAVFVDVFVGDISLPFYLTTKEAVSLLSSSLADNGVVILNMVSTFDKEKGKFLWAEYQTYKQVFPQVYLFGVRDGNDTSRRQNIILVALKGEATAPLKSSDPEMAKYLSHLYTGEIPAAAVLTEDFAPVEQFTLAVQKWEN